MKLPDPTPPEPVKPADPFGGGGLFGGMNLQQPAAPLEREPTNSQPLQFLGQADISVSSINNVSKHSLEEPAFGENKAVPSQVEQPSAGQDKGFFFL